MNHLRELLDLPTTAIGWDSALDGSQAAALIAAAKLLGPHAQCFHMGDEERMHDLKVIPELLGGLPYRIVWFQFSAQLMPGMVGGVLAHEAADGGIEFTCFARVAGRWGVLWAAWCDSLASGMCSSFPEDEGTRDAVQGCGFMIRAFCSAMNCANVVRERHSPDAKLQKARAKRGKAPLFSYWTLKLDGRKERSEDRGGTHAGPRVHLRRGHPRQYAPGKWTWVQAHAVGNRTAGMVHKDYSAGPALVAAAR